CPSVMGLADARLCLSCTSASDPSAAISYSQSFRPSVRLSAVTRNETLLSATAALPPSPRSPDATGLPPCTSVGWLPGRRTLRPTCDVTKTRSAQTMGDEMPSPRSGDFHATFSVSLQRSGSPVSDDVPVAAGPLHCGQ